jgi:hypothetical protein
MINAPEFMIEQAEAKLMSEAMENVAKHYPVRASEKAIAWTNFAMIASMVYGPRIAAVTLKRKQTRDNRSNIRPINPS